MVMKTKLACFYIHGINIYLKFCELYYALNVTFQDVLFANYFPSPGIG